MIPRFLLPCLLVLIAAVGIPLRYLSAQKPIPIAELKREKPVSFENEILPLLQKNCLACHSASEGYGDLVLETPDDMLRGGDTGPAITPGKGAESLLLKIASHAMQPIMPPVGNDLEAQPLTSAELGLLKLWIDQGARSAGIAGLFSPREWRPLPPGTQPIYTLSITPDGQYAACGRANQIFIYHVPTGRLVTRLTDPALQAGSNDQRPGIAHLDLVQSLAFNSQGNRLASGGFRTAKIWRSPRDVQLQQIASSAQAVSAVAVSPNRQWAALGGDDNTIQLWNLTDEEAGPALTGHSGAITSLGFSRQGSRLYSASLDQTIRVWDIDQGKLLGRIATPQPLHALATVSQPLPAELTANVAKGEQPAESAAGGNSAEESPAPQPLEEMLVSASGNSLDHWTIPDSLPQPLPAALPTTKLMATTRGGHLLALVNAEGTIQVRDTLTDTVLHTWDSGENNLTAVALVPPATKSEDEAAESQPTAIDSPSDQAPAYRLATATAQGQIYLWEIDTGERLQSLQGSLTAIESLAARADGQALAAGNVGGQITQWNLATVAPEPIQATGSSVHVAVQSPDGQRLATAEKVAGRPAIVVRELSSGKTLTTLLGHAASVTALAFNAEATRLVSGSEDQTVRVWDLSEAKFPQVARFEGHEAVIGAVAFNTDATQVLSGAADGSLTLWSMAADAEPIALEGHSASITGVAMLGGAQPVSASTDKTLRFWNPSDGKPSRTITESAAITALASSSDSAKVAVATGLETKIYQATDRKLLTTLPGLTTPALSLSFTSDNSRLLSFSESEAAVHRVVDGRLLEIVSPQQSFTAGAIAATGDRLYLCNSQGAIDRRALRFAQAFDRGEQPITRLIYRTDHQVLFAASAEGIVRGITLSTGQDLFNTKHGSPVHDLALSGDQQLLASAGEAKVKLWNATNGASAQVPELIAVEGQPGSVCFSTNGTQLIVAGTEPASLTVFSTAEGTAQQQLVSEEPIARVVVVDRPDANPLVLGLSTSGSLTLWQLLHRDRLTGHTGEVTSLASVEAMQVISGSLDGTLRHWDLTADTPQLRQMNHGGPITAVAAHVGAERFASVSENHTARLWNMSSGQQLAEMKGDLRAKEAVVKAQLQKKDWTAKVATATTALEAANKEVPIKAEAEKQAATALAAMQTDHDAKAAELAKANAAKVAAEKKAIAAAATAQASAAEMRKANAQAMQLAAMVGRQSQQAARAKAIASSNPNDDQLALLVGKAEAELTKLQVQAQAAEAAKKKPIQAAAAAAKVADDAAQVVVKMTKPYTDAATAMADAEQALGIASQAQAVAERDLQQAQAAVPLAEQQLALAEDSLQQAETDLAEATAAEQQAQQPLRSVAFSPDGLTLATAGDLPVVHTWSAESGKQVSSYAGHTGAIQALAYASADQIVSGAADQQAIVWDANPAWELERVIGSIDDPTRLIDRVVSVAFNQENTLLATGGGVPSRSGEVKIWNLSSGDLLHALPDAHTDVVNAVRFSPDDDFLATASADKLIKKWDVASGKQLLQLEGHTEHVLGLDWRANGQMLISSGADATVRTWNAVTGDRIRTINGYNKQVTDIRFVGQTQFAVAVSGDPLIRMHNTDNGGTQRNFSGAEDYMYAVDCTPDSSIVIAGGHAGVLRVYNGTNGQLLHSIAAPASENEETVAAEGDPP